MALRLVFTLAPRQSDHWTERSDKKHSRRPRQRDREKRNLIEFRRFLPIHRVHTHTSVLQPKACKIRYKWYISSGERGFVSVFNVGTVFFLLLFLSLLFSFCSVWSFEFLRLNESPSLTFALALSVCANLLTLSLCSFWAANEPEPYVIYLLFIIKHLIIRIRATIRFMSIVVAENNKSPLLAWWCPYFFLYSCFMCVCVDLFNIHSRNGHIIC